MNETPISSLESGTSDLISFYKSQTTPPTPTNSNNSKNEDESQNNKPQPPQKQQSVIYVNENQEDILSFNYQYGNSQNLNSVPIKSEDSNNSLSLQQQPQDYSLYEEEEYEEDYNSQSFMINENNSNEILFTLENNNNNNYQTVSLAVWDAVTSQDPKLIFARGGEKIKRKRGITIPDEIKQRDQVTIDDLMKTDFLRIGDRLTYTVAGLQHVGILMRGGFIEYRDETLPSVHSWLVKVLSGLEPNKKFHWFSPYDGIFLRGKSLNHIRTLFESMYYKSSDNQIIKRETTTSSPFANREDLSRKRVLENQFALPTSSKLYLNSESTSPLKKLKSEHSQNSKTPPKPQPSSPQHVVVLTNNNNNNNNQPTQMSIDEDNLPTVPLPDDMVINLEEEDFRSQQSQQPSQTPSIKKEESSSPMSSYGHYDIGGSMQSESDDDTTLTPSLTIQPKSYISPMKPKSHSQPQPQRQSPNNSKLSPQQTQSQDSDHHSPYKVPPNSKNNSQESNDHGSLSNLITLNNISNNNSNNNTQTKAQVSLSDSVKSFKTPSPLNSQYISQPLYQTSQPQPQQQAHSQSQSQYKATQPPYQTPLPSQNLSNDKSQNEQESKSQQNSTPTKSPNRIIHLTPTDQTSIKNINSQQSKSPTSQAKQDVDSSFTVQANTQSMSFPPFQIPNSNTIHQQSSNNNKNNDDEMNISPQKSVNTQQSSSSSVDIKSQQRSLSKIEVEQDTCIKESSEPKPVILGTGLSNVMKLHIISLCNAIGGRYQSTFDDSVTHVVCLSESTDGSHRITKRTIKYQLGALKSNVKVVSFDWILDSLVQSKWLLEDTYEITGDTNSPTDRSRQLLHEKRLFYGYTFYLAEETFVSSPSLSEITSLIRQSGGIVLNGNPPNPENLQELLSPKCVVLCHPKYTSHQQSKKIYLDTKHYPLSFKWILDSISNYEILEQELYIVNISSDSIASILNEQPTVSF
ncbi:hypothetical protein DLAC_06700 [Tieghemostelium lacteum]|uniref:BRCT domain-containing protein n=1 Tax=Tieghemostelium lacteum TaxID=361077 RepID=A0A151ZFL1_TIELA|nr:hypothetical protein DLAC_06700 [Tieghemostelium lacteum]|eukprot:KYQ92699.1 hypothetical protein DLAC_06700 [Tieghemostelium lacteum]